MSKRPLFVSFATLVLGMGVLATGVATAGGPAARDWSGPSSG